MKKILIIIMMFMTVLTLTSCLNHQPIPYGKWENETIGLILDINPDSGFYGTYDNHGKIMDIIILSPVGINHFYICENDDHNKYGSYGSVLFRGAYQVKDNKLYYTLELEWQEKVGIKDTIVFEQIDEYDVPVVSGSFASSQENSHVWTY